MVTKAKTSKKSASKKVEETREDITSLKTVRIVLDVPSNSLERLKMLCHLMGDTQSSVVTTAIDNYVADKKELIEQFIELRAKVTK